jgi:hypothetical protein
MPSSPATMNEEDQVAAAERENYVEASAFETDTDLGDFVEGKDWSEEFTDDELEEQDAELRSVVYAQQEAEVVTDDDVVVGW